MHFKERTEIGNLKTLTLLFDSGWKVWLFLGLESRKNQMPWLDSGTRKNQGLDLDLGRSLEKGIRHYAKEFPTPLRFILEKRTFILCRSISYFDRVTVETVCQNLVLFCLPGLSLIQCLKYPCIKGVPDRFNWKSIGIKLSRVLKD